jgi:hypothetical protein
MLFVSVGDHLLQLFSFSPLHSIDSQMNYYELARKFFEFLK